jgi:hypothetical protein
VEPLVVLPLVEPLVVLPLVEPLVVLAGVPVDNHLDKLVVLVELILVRFLHNIVDT